MMLDSGANIDAANIEEHVKDYVPFIDCNAERNNAESACGGVLPYIRRCTEGLLCFAHLKPKVPVPPHNTLFH